MAPTLVNRAQEAFERRHGPASALAAEAEAVADACQAMAARFRRGGRLLAFGNGGPSPTPAARARRGVRP